MHESLISEEESQRTYRAGLYYAIQPMLPELLKNQTPMGRDFIGEYSSERNVMSRQQTYDLLKKYNLLLSEKSSPHTELREMIR